jgi:hypothetical protein
METGGEREEISNSAFPSVVEGEREVSKRAECIQLSNSSAKVPTRL